MWIEHKEKESLQYKIKKLYWKIVPHKWRPLEIWYRLKCFVWHRYTTIHPKTLPWHTWTDRCVLLPHAMFSVLVDFIEGECSPGYVDWYGEYPHVINVDVIEKNVRDEMQELYDWWKNSQTDYTGWPEIYDVQLRKEYEENLQIRDQKSRMGFRPLIKNEGDKIEYYEFYTEYDSIEDEQLCNTLSERNIEITRQDQELLIKNMCRLCRLQPYLWI